MADAGWGPPARGGLRDRCLAVRRPPHRSKPFISQRCLLSQADYAHARRGETFDSAGDTAIVVSHPPAAGSDLSPPLRRGLLLSPHSGVTRRTPADPGAKRGARSAPSWRNVGSARRSRFGGGSL